MGVKEEKARQSCWCWTQTGRDMKPVAKQPTRCHKMLEEAGSFSKRLATCEGQIRTLKKAVDGMLHASEKILAQPLPKVWESTETGEVIPLRETGTPLTNSGQLQRSHSVELKNMVMDPISSWQADYQRMKIKIGALDTQSLRVDEARRQYYKTSSKHVKENVLKVDNVNEGRPTEEGDTQLTTARAAYQKMEVEAWEELRQLLEKCRGVQEYITKAMELQGDTLLAASRTHAQPRTGGATSYSSSLAGSAEFPKATGGGSFSPGTSVNQSYATT